MRTRYSWGNLVILVAGTLLCMALIPYVGWVSTGVHAPAGGKRLAEDLVVFTVVLTLPAFLLGWRWPRVSAYTLWTLTLALVVLAVDSGALWPMLIPIVVVGGVSGLASWVEAWSAAPAAV